MCPFWFLTSWCIFTAQVGIHLLICFDAAGLGKGLVSYSSLPEFSSRYSNSHVGLRATMVTFQQGKSSIFGGDDDVLPSWKLCQGQSEASYKPHTVAPSTVKLVIHTKWLGLTRKSCMTMIWRMCRTSPWMTLGWFSRVYRGVLPRLSSLFVAFLFRFCLGIFPGDKSSIGPCHAFPCISMLHMEPSNPQLTEEKCPAEKDRGWRSMKTGEAGDMFFVVVWIACIYVQCGYII